MSKRGGLLLLSLVFTVLLVSQSYSMQYARPDQDIRVGAWTTSPLFSKVNENPFSDSNWIRSNNLLSPTQMNLSLSSLIDPQVSYGHVIKYRYNKSAAGGQPVFLGTRLMQGNTVIFEDLSTISSGSFVNRSLTLTAVQANAITDYSNLTLDFKANGSAILPRRGLYISYIELVVPDRNSTLFYFNFTNRSSPITNEAVKFNINWTDYDLLSKNFFETNLTGIIRNYSIVLSGKSSNVNITNRTSSAGIFYWKSYANDSNDNWNNTNKMIFTVVSTTSTTTTILGTYTSNLSELYTYPTIIWNNTHDSGILKFNLTKVINNITSSSNDYYSLQNATLYLKTTACSSPLLPNIKLDFISNLNWTDQNDFLYVANLKVNSTKFFNSLVCSGSPILKFDISRIFNYTAVNLYQNLTIRFYETRSNLTTYDGWDGSSTAQMGKGSDYYFYANAWSSAARPTLQLTYRTYSETTTTVPPSSSGGGSSSSEDKPFYDFSVYPEDFKIVLKQGETVYKTLTLENKGNRLLDFSLTPSLTDMVAVSESQIGLLVGQKKTINLAFSSSRDQQPRIYNGVLTLQYGSLVKRILTVIEVVSLKPLFDIKVTLPVDYLDYYTGQAVDSDIFLYNFGDLKPVDVTLHYAIRDESGKELVYNEETLAVTEQLTVQRSLVIPESLQPGNYFFYANIIYGNQQEASSSSIFQVKKEQFQSTSQMYGIDLYLQLALIVLFLVSTLFLAIIIYQHRKLSHSSYNLFLRSEISKLLSQGYSKQQVFSAAVKQGWPEKLIKKVLYSL